jgi:hypothetical protein
MLNISIQGKGADPDLWERLKTIRKALGGFLRSPSVDPVRFKALCISAQRIFLESQARGFKRMRIKRSKKLMLDTNPRITVVSGKSREEGEADLFEARGKEGKEEAYLFVRHHGKGRKGVPGKWFEVGNKESAGAASISIYQIGAILQLMAKKGKVLEASLYHYHPDVRGRVGSRISLQDLSLAARYYSIVGKLVPASLDFRVVNREGIHTFSGVTFDKILAMGKAGLNRMESLKGAPLARYLRSRSIPCSFQPHLI